MKKILISMLAVAALVSCSKEESIRVDQGEAIAFGNAFVDNATRADYSDGVQKLTKFSVYGTVTGTAGTVNIFNGVEVTGNVGDAVWSYGAQYAQYWIAGADYNFAAVVDANVATKDSYNMPLTLTTIADDATSNLEDMLYATASVDNAAANQGTVSFTFSHLLSKAKFTVTSTAQGNYYHTVTGIKVSNFATGTYTIADGSWAGVTAKDVAFAEIAEVTSANTNGLSNAEMLLVPNAATFNVTFTVEVWNNNGNDDATDDVKLGTETKSITVDTDLLKGNAYNFTIACSVGNPIQFTVTNDPTWADETDVTVQ